MYRGTCGYAYETRGNIDLYRCNVNKKGSSLQSQVLESYRMNPNALFELLQKKDLYDEPNIKSLYYENLPQLFSIFKETPSFVDDLLCGNITKIMSQRIRPEDNNWSEIIQTLKNAPKALDELLSAADSKTGKTLMHDFGKEQNVNALSTINEIYKDSPEKLKELYSKKDKFEAIRLRTGWSGGDGYYDYKSSEKTPLEYLTPENLAGLREKYPILNDIKL